MKTLYLHIGTPKTATTSIQQFLVTNRSVLETHGYCYPKSAVQYVNVNLNRNGHFLIGKTSAIVDEKGKATQKKAYATGMKRLHKCLDKYGNVILSDESIWNAVDHSKKDAYSLLLEDARQYSYQIKIIVYLRRQDQSLSSYWNQAVKGPFRETRPYEQYSRDFLVKNPDFFHYEKKLDLIAEIFGKENVIVRRFEPSTWVDHDILHDFMHYVGLPITPDFAYPDEESNTGLKGNNVEIKRIINEIEEFTDEETAYLRKILKLSPNDGGGYRCNMLSRQEAIDFLAPFQEENQHVAERYIGDGKPMFSDEFKDIPKWELNNPYMDGDLIRFFSTAVIDLHRENQKLSQGNKQLCQENRQLWQETQKLHQEIANVKNSLGLLRYKLHHPFRTLWKRLFKRE